MFLYSYIDPYITGNVQFTDALSYDIGETGAREQLVANARKLMEHFADRLRSAMKRGEAPMVKFDHTVVEGARRRNHRIRTNKPSPTHHNGYARS